jgi:hypothetical protein
MVPRTWCCCRGGLYVHPLARQGECMAHGLLAFIYHSPFFPRFEFVFIISAKSTGISSKKCQEVIENHFEPDHSHINFASENKNHQIENN